jgi:proteasome lid subunit RPN8/RPN11
VSHLVPITTPLPASSVAALEQLSRSGRPDEAVAAVFLDDRGHHHVRRLANRHSVPATGFAVDPLEFADVEAAERRAGRRLCAWFHSHPFGRAAPSAADIAQAWAGIETWIGGFCDDDAFELARFARAGRP